MGVVLLHHVCIYKVTIEKVDPFITKRAHQISVTWAHWPIPYYS